MDRPHPDHKTGLPREDGVGVVPVGDGTLEWQHGISDVRYVLGLNRDFAPAARIILATKSGALSVSRSSVVASLFSIPSVFESGVFGE